MWWVETAFLCPWFGNLELKLCVSGRSEAKEASLAQLSLMRWAEFSCFQYWEREEKINYFHSRGCRIWKHFIFLPRKITYVYNTTYSYIFKRTLVGETGGLLVYVLFRITRFPYHVRLSGCCPHGSCCAVPLADVPHCNPEGWASFWGCRWFWWVSLGRQQRSRAVQKGDQDQASTGFASRWGTDLAGLKPSPLSHLLMKLWLRRKDFLKRLKRPCSHWRRCKGFCKWIQWE